MSERNDATVPATRPNGYRAAQLGPASVLVLDPLGEIFDRVRDLMLPATLLRAVDPQRIARGMHSSLVVYGAYRAVDWAVASRLDECGPTVVVTTSYHREEALDALRKDLVGYMDAILPRDALDRALRGLLLRKEHAFPREVVGSWVWQQRLGRQEQAGATGLTPRQHEIVTLIARGATDKEIAAALGIATATAQKHVTNILQRLQVPNRAAAVAATTVLRSSWAA
jgi:DNA-binding NarL/FixJ family response regulator